MGYTMMRAPASDDESSEHPKDAPKWSREQPRMPPAPQLRVTSPPTSPPHAKVQGGLKERPGSPPPGGELENVVPRRLYERDFQPQLQRRYSVPKLISW